MARWRGTSWSVAAIIMKVVTITCAVTANTQGGFDYLIYAMGTSIQFLPADERVSYIPQPLTDVGNVAAIAPVPTWKEVYFSVILDGAILSFSFENDLEIRNILTGIGEVNGMAFNHLTDEIFWTSYTKSSISKMRVSRDPNASLAVQEVVAMSRDNHPRGIALDVCAGDIFWTNLNFDTNPSIMKSTMAGEDVKAIVTTDIVIPNGITIDLLPSKLYWCDATLDKIERMNLDGSNRVIIVDSGLGHPFAITVHENFLYLTNWMPNAVLRVSKYPGNGTVDILRDLPQSPFGISVLTEPQSCEDRPCYVNNGGCGGICSTDEYGTVFCTCPEGQTLDVDSQRCTDDNIYIVYSERTNIKWFPVDATSDDDLEHLFDVQRAVAVAPVPSWNGMFFSDIYQPSGKIMFSSLGDEPQIRTVFTEVGTVVGMAFNHLTDELFWTSYQNASVNRMKVSRDPSAPLVAHEIVSMGTWGILRGITLDVCTGHIYWTVISANSSIMKSTMSGGDARAIITTDIDTPNGITIDLLSSKLYWVDAELDKIERADLDGTNRMIIVTSGLEWPFAMTVHGNFLYLTDWTLRAVLRVDKYSGSNLTEIYNGFPQLPFGISVFREPLSCDDRPCYPDNGGCDGTCSTDEYGTITCTCPEGQFLGPDGRMCIAAHIIYTQKTSIQWFPVDESYDGKPQHLIYATSPPAIVTVPSWNGMFFSDISTRSIMFSSLGREGETRTVIAELDSVEGMAFNHLTDELFWTSYTNSSISRMRVSMEFDIPLVEQILVRMSSEDRLRGIALDLCTGDMFWTNWNSENPSIMKSTLSGDNVGTIITTNIAIPNGITIDMLPSKLYWCDALLDKIERAELDGSNRVVITNFQTPHPFAITVYQDSLYVTDWRRYALLRINKYSGEEVAEIQTDSPQQPLGISVFAEPQSCDDRPCHMNNGGCEGSCSTDEYGTVICSCPEGLTLGVDGQGCLAPVTEDASFRLVGGSTSEEGRVEVYINGVWGTVCDDGWSIRESDVVCHQLGFGPAADALPRAHFGRGTGPILMDDVRCSGREETLMDCQFSRTSNCDHREDVSVVCTSVSDGDLRLVSDTNRFEGRLEVYLGGEWGSVCDDHWSPQNTEVACSQLGFGGGQEYMGSAHYGTGKGPVKMDDVVCSGSERRLTNCTYITDTNCNPEEAVGIRCDVPDTGSVRLLGGQGPHEGRVEVYIDGEWGSVCDNDWGLSAARVVCRQLGYSEASTAVGSAFFGKAQHPVQLDNVVCDEDVTRLLDCSYTARDKINCGHDQDAGVVCQDYEEGAIRLAGGNSTAGRVEIYLDGQWGTVCDDLWDREDADVVCRELGFRESLAAHRNAVFGEGNDPIHLDDVECRGDEASITECPHTRTENCDHYEDAGVTCQEQG